MESVNYRSLWVFYAYSSSYIKDKVNGIFEIYIISILLSFKITYSAVIWLTSQRVSIILVKKGEKLHQTFH